MDRRVARTRAALHAALLSLLDERHYETITVEDICLRADVGRSTFYGHYRCKDDLMRSGFSHLPKLLRKPHKDPPSAPAGDDHGELGFSLPMFEHARDHMHLHRTLVGNRGGIVALGTIREILCDVVRSELAAAAGGNVKDSMPRELVVQYLVGAFMAVATWWLDGGARLMPQQVDSMFQRLATRGLSTLHGNAPSHSIRAPRGSSARSQPR